MSNLLVVDDEPKVVSFLTRFLVAEGHSVATAHDGPSALAHLHEKDVDLVLLDLVMPRMSGLQVLADMQADGSPCPPVIVLSAVTEAARVQALDRGAVDFVQKPVHAADLVARVRRHLLRSPEQRHAGADRFLRAGDISSTSGSSKRQGSRLRRGAHGARVRPAGAPDEATRGRVPQGRAAP